MALPTRIRGTARFVRKPRTTTNLATLWAFISFGLQIGDLNRLPVENGTSRENAPRQGQRVRDENWPIVGNEWKRIAINLMNRRIMGIAEAGCTHCDLGEHPLQICRRARNHLQYLYGSGLLLPSFG